MLCLRILKQYIIYTSKSNYVLKDAFQRRDKITWKLYKAHYNYALNVISPFQDTHKNTFIHSKNETLYTNNIILILSH